MNIIGIDRILSAVERAKGLGTIPESKVAAVVAQSLGIEEAIVLEVMLADEAAA